MEKKSLPITFLLLLMGVILIPTFVLAINTVAEGYAIPPSTGVNINAHSVCRDVFNGSAVTYFIPTRSSSEWFSFRFNMPPGVTDQPACGCAGSCTGDGTLHSICHDGCGGICPTPPCQSPLKCNGLTCEMPGTGCTPTHNCDQVYCGDNGCGTQCTCNPGDTCLDSKCTSGCVPTYSCNGSYCGDDGCGTICTCNAGQVCSGTSCITAPTGTSCQNILDQVGGTLPDGVYTLNNGSGDYQAYCDMTTDGGGWTLLFNLETADSGVRTWDDSNFWTKPNVYGSASSPWSADFKSAAYNQMPLGQNMMVMVHNQGTTVYGKAIYNLNQTGSPLLNLMASTNLQISDPRSNLISGSALSVQGYDPFIHGDGQNYIVLNDMRTGTGHGSGSSYNNVRFSTSYGSADSHETYGLGGLHDIQCSCGHWGWGYEASVDTTYCNVFRTGSNSQVQLYNGYTSCPSGTVEVDYAVFAR